MTITISGWVYIIIGIIFGIGGIAAAISCLRKQDKKGAILWLCLGLMIAVAFISHQLVYSNTEAGKRAYKDQVSNFDSGITRTVTVYDINGNIIEQYSGKFDVETDNPGYVLFDDENGKRHIIYFTTGTVIIDEE